MSNSNMSPLTDKQSIYHPEFGELTFDKDFGWWNGSATEFGISIIIDSQPNIESNIENIKRFLDWYSSNKEAFTVKMVDELFNYDLIHGENFIEGGLDLDEDTYEKEHIILESKVRKSLVIKDINSMQGKLSVWLSAGEYTSDHWIKTALDVNHEILEMSHG